MAYEQILKNLFTSEEDDNTPLKQCAAMLIAWYQAKDSGEVTLEQFIAYYGLAVIDAEVLIRMALDATGVNYIKDRIIGCIQAPYKFVLEGTSPKQENCAAALAAQSSQENTFRMAINP